ncbi:hypothetical protein MTO96_050228 [Rhipicephalus appendiculatus]
MDSADILKEPDFLVKYNVVSSKDELPSRTTLARGALSDIYECMKATIKDIIKKGPRFCALTYDLWTDSYKRRSYINFTCHFMTEKFSMCNLTLCTQSMTERHTGKAIFEEYSKCLEEFEMTEKNVQALGKLASHITDTMLLAAQWDQVQELAHFLKNFRSTVEILSKEKEVTASLLLVLRSEIKEVSRCQHRGQPNAEVHERKDAQQI